MSTKLQRGDWVRSFHSEGIVRRVAKDGSWADVDWGSWVKRVRHPERLEIVTTIVRGGWEFTDLTRERERTDAD